jgi:hypothetical protein
VTYSKGVTQQDIPAYRYSVPPEVFAASGDNIGFCNPSNDTYYPEDHGRPQQCLPDGLLDVTACQPGMCTHYIANVCYVLRVQAIHRL